MEAYISRYAALRPSRKTRDNKRETDALKTVIDAAPYVVSVLEGSYASLDYTRAVEEQEEGTEVLVASAPPYIRRESPFSDLLKEGLVEVTPVQLVNAKREEAQVTLNQAIQFFNSFEGGGVDINKVSTNGNSRGFYRVEALKSIAKGIGIRLVGDTSKGAYVEAIHAFHTQNEEAIARDRESKRVK